MSLLFNAVMPSTPSCGVVTAYPHVFLIYFKYICISFLSDVEAFARAMQGTKGDSKEKKEDDEDMSLD